MNNDVILAFSFGAMFALMFACDQIQTAGQILVLCVATVMWMYVFLVETYGQQDENRPYDWERDGL